eukprot:ANDGO_08166.mRNA.1 DNA mismatch repair protein MSH5
MSNTQEQLSLRDSDETLGSIPNGSANGFRSPSAGATSILPVARSTTEEEPADSESGMIVLSFCRNGNQLGMAFYSSDSNSLLAGQFAVQATSSATRLRELFSIIQPTIVLTSSAVGEELISVCQSALGQENVVLKRPSEFAVDHSMQKLMCVRPGGMELEKLGEVDRAHALLAILGYSARKEGQVAVCALGALISHLQQNQTLINHDGPPNAAGPTAPVHVSYVQRFDLEQYMFVSEDTKRALQIIPDGRKGGTTSKILGLHSNIYDLVNRTVSAPGKRAFRQVFQTPLRDTSILEERHDAVEYFMKTENCAPVQEIISCLKRIKDATAMSQRICTGIATYKDWLGLQASMEAVVGLVATIDNHPDLLSVPAMANIAALYTREMSTVAKMLFATICKAESAANSRIVINPGVSGQLDLLKKMYASLDEFLDRVADEEHEKLRHVLDPIRSGISSFCILWTNNYGFHLSIQASPMSKDHLLQCTQMQYMFSEDSFLHFKNDRMTVLDNEIGDLHSQIIDLENKILMELTDELSTHILGVQQLFDAVGFLDVLIAFSAVSKLHSWCRPRIEDRDDTKDRSFRFENLRHPLVDVCVPNNISQETSTGRIHVITGANSSGKSIILKQVGIAVFLAHVGCFVPAEEAVLPLFDSIQSRISSHDAIAGGYSMFAQDLYQTSRMIFDSGAKSLLLIDEFGKGTTVEDGVSLLGAILNFWIGQTDMCPTVLVSTHYTDVLELLNDKRQMMLRMYTMKCIIAKPEETHNGSQIVFLYTMEENSQSGSFGLQCAKICGVPRTVLERAATVRLRLHPDFTVMPDLLQSLEDTPSQASDHAVMVRTGLLETALMKALLQSEDHTNAAAP